MSEPTWCIIEMVEFALKQRAQAEQHGVDFIFVQEIHPGAERCESSIEKFTAIVQWAKDEARKRGIAYVVLRRKSGIGWFLDDYFNTVGDRIAVNAWIQLTAAPLSAEAAA